MVKKIKSCRQLSEITKKNIYNKNSIRINQMPRILVTDILDSKFSLTYPSLALSLFHVLFEHSICNTCWGCCASATGPIEPDSTDFILRGLTYCKGSNSYMLRKHRKLSYSTAREVLLSALQSLGLDKSMFGLHSLRAGGASTAASAGIADRMFKKHVEEWQGQGRVCQRKFRSTIIWNNKKEYIQQK
jgi:hypothetical protein